MFEQLKFAGKERGIKIKIVQNQPEKGKTVADTELLAKEGKLSLLVNHRVRSAITENLKYQCTPAVYQWNSVV